MDNNAPRTGRPGPHDQDQTITTLERPSPASPRRPHLALVPGSGPHLSDEIHSLLRRRLRVAGLIGLVGFALFFIKGLLYRTTPGPDSLDLALHAVLVAELTLLCSLLWTQIPLSTRVLRAIELLMFGGMASFFAFVQFRVYHGDHCLLGMLKGPEGSGQCLVLPQGQEGQVIALVNWANAMRWFILIVLYGTFIPNTWKRCALVVGALAATPMVLNFVICFPCSVKGPYTGPVLFDTTVVLGLGSAIAIFGSYKINELQEEAYQARKLGQYQLQRRLGAGGMGEVYLGEHVLLRRACAIKVIRPDQAGDLTTLSRFEREVQAMATLTHPNTVEVYDYGHADDGMFYYVMEYLPGLSLQELVDRHGPLPPGRAIHFLRQLCGALREAHGIGLIHRDIKPSNVIACQRGGVHDVAKLLDFGLVHDVGLGASGHQITIQGTILGSPPYVSPEQARGRGAIDRRTDIYSLGGLAYFLLTGQAPFVRETAMELLVAHVHEAPTPPRQLRPDIPADLEEVVMRCLRKSPHERYPDAESLDRALSRCEAAGEWDEEQAAIWWGERVVEDTAPRGHAALSTEGA